MEKRYLFTPGPTPVPPEVLAATAEPMVHHRGADFRRGLRALRSRGSQQVFRTEAQVLLFAASGTGAMESAVANLTRAGDRVAVVAAGAFGERWATICEQLRARRAAHRLRVGRGARSRTRSARPSPRAARGIVFCTQSETSTGVVADVQALKAAVGDATLVVDAISSLGAVPLETDAWGIDVVVSGSQKALMCPPGLAMASVAEPPLGRLPHVAELLLRLARDHARRRRCSTRRSRRPSR